MRGNSPAWPAAKRAPDAPAARATSARRRTANRLAWLACACVGLGVCAPATAAPRFLSYSTVSAPGVAGAGGSAFVTYDRSGSAVALWTTFDAKVSGVGVQTATLAPGASVFGPVSQVAAPNPAPLGSRQLMALTSASGQSDVIAVWLQAARKGNEIDAVIRPPGGAFGAPQALSASVGENAQDVRLAEDANGNAVVAWTSRPGFEGPFRLLTASRPAGGSFEPPRELVPAAQAPTSPTVAFDADGNAVVGWVSLVGGVYSVQMANRPSGGNFGPPRTLESTMTSVDELSLATGASGAMLASWRVGMRSAAAARAALRPVGGDFGSPVAVTSGDVEAVRGFQQSGNAATALWRRVTSRRLVQTGPHGEQSEVTTGYLESAAQSGAGFGAPQAFPVAGQQVDTAQLALTRDPLGDALVAVGGPVRAAASPAGDSFSALVNLGGSASLAAPGVALNNTGGGVVVWSEDAKNQVYASLLSGLSGPALPDVAPVLDLAATPKLRAVLRAGGVPIAVSCTVTCRLNVTGTFGSVRLRAIVRTVSAGPRLRLRVAIPPSALRRLRRRLRHTRSADVRVVLTATDPSSGAQRRIARKATIYP